MAHRRLNGTPVKPNPPAPGSSSAPTTAGISVIKDEHRSNKLKRAREDDTEAEAEGTPGDVPVAKRRGDVNQDVLYRIVVPSRHIGKVIGREGHRIQKIREETQATIKIADAIGRHEERVIIITSRDNENDLCNAELALHQVASLILMDDGVNVETPKLDVEHVAANTIRLLICGSQAGGLIGLNGQNIENLRTSSGASISVLSEALLPMCASAHESDRVVQISGDMDSVQKAVMEIGCHLRYNPPNEVIVINLPHKHGFGRQPHQYVDPSSAEYVNLDIMVPESMVGGLIGRCGSNISRIRTESGATIKVYGGKGEQTQRQIHLGGNAQQVGLAKQRIDEYVFSQMMPHSGVQQPMPAASSALFQANSYLQANPLLQGYGPNGGVYMNSNHGTSVIPVNPAAYTTSAADQAVIYNGQSYQAPPL